MKAVVVYQSLWGSSAAVARAIAEGLGGSARALSTNESLAAALAGVDLVVAGCPVHAFGLPSADSVKQAVAKPAGKDAVRADPSHMLMRDWLDALPRGTARAAAFDTRVKGILGRGGATKVMAGLEKAGYRRVAKPEGFLVAMRPIEIGPEGMLLPGEVARAREWGKRLKSLVEVG